MPQVYAKTTSGIPTPAAEAAQIQVRGSKYGDGYFIPMTTPAHSQVGEGSRFIALAPTPDTAIAGPIAATISETAPHLLIYNTSAGSNAKTLVLDSIRLFNTVIPASSTDFRVQFAIDTGNRLTSGGTTLTVANANMNSSNASNATVTFGNITATAASGSRRWVEWGVVKTAVVTAKDEFNLVFGQTAGATFSAVANQGTTASTYIASFNGIAIGPGHSLLVYCYFASNATTAGSWTPVVSFYER